MGIIRWLRSFLSWYHLVKTDFFVVSTVITLCCCIIYLLSGRFLIQFPIHMTYRVSQIKEWKWFLFYHALNTILDSCPLQNLFCPDVAGVAHYWKLLLGLEALLIRETVNSYVYYVGSSQCRHSLGGDLKQVCPGNWRRENSVQENLISCQVMSSSRGVHAVH